SPRSDLVHAVQRAQEGGLATARRTNECGHGTGFNIDIDVTDGQEITVIAIKIDGLDAFCHGCILSFRKIHKLRHDYLPVVGAKYLAIARAARFSPITMRISTRAPAHARAADGSPAPGAVGLIS